MFGIGSGIEWAVASSVLTYAAVMMIGRGLARRRGAAAVGAAFHLFAVLIAFRIGAPLYLQLVPGYDQRIWWSALETLTILTGTLAGIELFSFVAYDVYLPRIGGSQLPRIVHDITKVVAVIIAVAVILKIEFGMHIAAILTTSTILAATVGLAMQELLTNLIAGVAMQFEKPFSVGDWVTIDGMDGQVVGMSWRATRMQTTEGKTIVVPNGMIAKGLITNYSYPTPAHALLATVGVSYEVPPNRVKECLREAAGQCSEVLLSPAPLARITGFGDSSITYEVKYWIKDHAREHDIGDAVMTFFWYRLKRENIRIPFPIRTVQLQRRGAGEDVDAEPRDLALRALSRASLFGSINAEQIDELADRAQPMRFADGETVVRQGDTDQCLFVIEKGTATIEVARDGAGGEVHSLGEGDYFGEISLLTGEPRMATVRAKGDLLLLRIDRDAIAPILEANSGLIEEMSRVLAERRKHTENRLKDQPSGAAAEPDRKSAEWFVSTIRRYFKLG